MNKYLPFICLLLVFSYSVSRLSAQKYKPYIYIESSTGLSKIVYHNQKISFKDSQGQTWTGKIHIYNDTQFCFINYFNEVESDTFHLGDINSIYLKSSNARRTPLILPILGIIFVPYIAIPVIIIAYLVKGKKSKRSGAGASGWYHKDEFKISIKDLYETI